ncbi:MAG: tetratricopeptide repeat protein [Leptospiraceae bacterium]|nr:tetratricopeptide repeat protein [Leptospiraceae bacterium]
MERSFLINPIKLISFVLILAGALSCSGSKPADRPAAEAFYKQGKHEHTKTKDYAQAISFYEKAYQADQTWWRPLYQLGCVYSLKGDTDQSIAYLKQAIQTEKDPELLAYLQSDSDLRRVRQTPGFAELNALIYSTFESSKQASNSTTDNLAGRKICRAGDVVDKTMFKISLKADGSIKGTGSSSGMMGLLELQGGTWSQRGDQIQLTLRFAGKQFKSDGSGEKEAATNNLEYQFKEADLQTFGDGCQYIP